MYSPPLLPVLIQQLLTQFPLALVFIVGFILALMKWSQHPKPAALVLIASILGLLRSIASALFTVWISTGQGSHSQHAAIYNVWGIFIVLISVIISALLLAAAFIGRPTNTAPLTHPRSPQ